MTHAAQAALRRTMEKETRSTGFCLICNYVSRVIEPLTSRCTKFRFKLLNESMIFERLSFICEKEGIKASDDVLNKLVETSGGDMRRAITCLQSSSRLKGKDTDINIKDILEVTGVVPREWLEEYLKVCKSSNYSQLEQFIEKFMYEAYSGLQVLTRINNKQKAIIGEKLGLTSFRLQDGFSEYIQLLDLGCTLMTVYAMG